MKTLKIFTLFSLFCFLLSSCEQDGITDATMSNEKIKTIYTPSDYTKFASAFEKSLVYQQKTYSQNLRTLDFDPIPYLAEANDQYPGDDLVNIYNTTPEYVSLGNWDNIIDYIGDPLFTPEVQTALMNLFDTFDDSDVQIFVDIVDASPDEATAKMNISNELINRLNDWYNIEAPNLNTEDTNDLLEAKMFAEAVIPIIIDNELEQFSTSYRGWGSKLKKFIKKKIKKVVSVVKGIVTGVKKGIKKAKSLGKSPFWGGVVGGILGGAKAWYITWKYNVCWFFGCDECCNSDSESANYSCADLFKDCENQTGAPWENFECEGQNYSFPSFKEYCKHFKD